MLVIVNKNRPTTFKMPCNKGMWKRKFRGNQHSNTRVQNNLTPVRETNNVDVEISPSETPTSFKKNMTYIKTNITYKHKNAIPLAVMETVKQIFKNLSA